MNHGINCLVCPILITLPLVQSKMLWQLRHFVLHFKSWVNSLFIVNKEPQYFILIWEIYQTLGSKYTDKFKATL